MITRELVGRALGIALLAALILGVPYLAFSFIHLAFDPTSWGMWGRFWSVAMSAVLLLCYGASQLPPTEPAREE